MTKFVVNPYDPSDLPCALCSPEAQEVGQEPAGAHVGLDVDPALVERLVALCEAFSATDIPCGDYIILKNEARAIMEAMKPVETDEQRVQRIWQDWIDGKGEGVKSVIALALAKGRQLEREGR